MDWLLALAVADKRPSEETQGNRTCTDAIPPTPAAAEERLMELWLKMGEQRFAASCR